MLLPSAKTCVRWKKRKFIRQPHRMVLGLLICLVVAIYASFNGETGAATLFGTLGCLFLILYAIANYIVWKAGDLEPEP